MRGRGESKPLAASALFARAGVLAVFLAVLAAAICVSVALADEGGVPEASIPGSSELQEGDGSPALVEPEPTDLGAAEELPHEDLGRPEAEELLEDVFQPEVQGPAGIYDDLHVRKFLAPNVAVMAPGEQPEISTEPGADGSLGRSGGSGATLMDSTVALATEAETGKLEAVDLNLERSDGTLSPANPLLEVEIPSELGEGIEVPGPEIGIELEGADESRNSSVIGDGVAFYPNISEETDLAVAPTIGGVETMTQLRSPEAAGTETYKLDLPAGASLTAEGGGAVVKRGERTLLTVAPPTALDAEGEPVATNMTVEGDRLTIKVSPTPTTEYPILVDPLFQSFEWYARHTGYEIPTAWGEGWEEESGSESPTGTSYYGDSVQYPYTSASMDAFVPTGSYGLDTSAAGHTGAGEARWWIYHVPRYKYDELDRGGSEPETFITRMTTSDVAWRAQSSSYSPYMVMGLWGTGAGWASLYTHESLSGHSINNMGYVYAFPNEQSVPSVKMALVGLYSPETVTEGINAELFVGASTVELSEPAASTPEFVAVSGPTEWLNTGKVYIQAQAKDAGLGVYAVNVSSEATGGPSWRVPEGCTGVAGSQSYCPFEVKLYDGIEPERLPTGIDKLNVTAEDPIGHTSPVAHVELEIDHTAPEVSLAGSVTEQATLGTKRGSYGVKVRDSDGTSAQPQSGVAKVFVEVDGLVVKETEPGCPVENCSIPLEATIESQKYTAGEHTLKVRVVDAAGNTTTVERKFTLDPSPPSLTLSGTMTEQATLGVTRPGYDLRIAATSAAGIATAPASPTYAASFGTAGSGNGQFSRPTDVARDAKGDLWVVDEGHNRIEEFGPKGEYISQFGTEGTGQGQLRRPTAIAVGPEGDLWVADTGNRRVEKFNSQGQYLSSFGSSGSGSGKFVDPDGIALDAKGDIWVADGYSGRLEEFGPTGTWLQTVTGKGGAGLLYDPVGIAVGPEGNIWTVDLEMDRVVEFEPNGTFVRWFGEYGTGNGQFEPSGALAVDAHGDVWVGDTAGGRVEEFTSEGRYLAKFGSKGSGEGQFNLGYDSGITVGPIGTVWVTDPGNNRVQKWTIASTAPTFSASFGTAGAGNGQFIHPAGVARDVRGDLWVVDQGDDRIEEFGPGGGYLSQFGTEGTGPGQLKTPTSIAVGPEGDLWVADSGNHRVEKFDPEGHFLLTFGSSGSGNGQFGEPRGIAVDSGGNVWVADPTHHRVEEFSPGGVWMKNLTGTGKEGAGFLDWPYGVAIGPEGNLWIADAAMMEVDEFEPSGAFVRAVGGEGSGPGQFEEPSGIAVGPRGEVWVADPINQRIEEFDSDGRYLAQFGARGSSEGQLLMGLASGMAVGPTGAVWIADYGNNRVEKWTPTESGSEVLTEVTLDGRPVESDGRSCAAEDCHVADEWVLGSSTVSPGRHEIAVTASDGLGNSVTRNLAIEIQRDTTSPSLEVGGELANAPEGWVQQETYGLHASATDAGYGVTSLVFKIDGQAVASESATCSEGGCGLSLASQVNMAKYSGGAHQAEIIATDGTGNKNVKSWTINVDPEGRITTQEETETLEAVESTSEQGPVAPTDQVLPVEQREGGDDPGLTISGSEITSTGVPDITTITTDPQDGFSIESPERTTEITPLVSEGSSSVSVQNGVAGTTANVANEVDSVIRPEYNGVQIAQAIRSEESPESFTWRVGLGPRQELIQANATQAEVVYTDGTEAFLITAEPAHDATGKPVPTSLSVNANELTLKVEFRGGGFTFPVVAGEGWETSYASPVMVEGPEDETQIREREEREQREREERERAESEGEDPEGPVPPPPAPPLTRAQAERLVQFNLTPLAEVAPPPEPPPGTATASSIRTFTVRENYTCQIDHCAIYKLYLRNPSYERGYNWVRWEPGTQVHCGWKQNPLYYLTPVVDEDGCGFTGPSKPYKGEDKHLTIYGRWSVTAFDITELVQEAFTKYPALQIWAWPNGWQQPIVKEWNPGVQE